MQARSGLVQIMFPFMTKNRLSNIRDGGRQTKCYSGFDRSAPLRRSILSNALTASHHFSPIGVIASSARKDLRYNKMQRLRYSGGMVWAKTGEGATSTNGGIPCANAVLYAYSTNELNLGCSEKRT